MKASSSISGGRRHRKSRLYAAASDWERPGRLLTYLGAACGTFLLRTPRFAIEHAVWVDAIRRIVQNQSIVAIYEDLHSTSTSQPVQCQLIILPREVSLQRVLKHQDFGCGMGEQSHTGPKLHIVGWS